MYRGAPSGSSSRTSTPSTTPEVVGPRGPPSPAWPPARAASPPPAPGARLRPAGTPPSAAVAAPPAPEMGGSLTAPPSKIGRAAGREGEWVAGAHGAGQ